MVVGVGTIKLDRLPMEPIRRMRQKLHDTSTSFEWVLSVFIPIAKGAKKI